MCSPAEPMRAHHVNLKVDLAAHIMPQRGWCFQTDRTWRMGPSLLCHLSPRPPKGSKAPTLVCYCMLLRGAPSGKHTDAFDCILIYILRQRGQAEVRLATLQSSLNPPTTTSSSSPDGILTDPPRPPNNASTNNKTARAYTKTYKPGPTGPSRTSVNSTS